jgi:dTDP-3-amino-2,3,6-trideoxy-4-keto-D-glucose/dTDP-3-amino-3,4,6-trideoxy-alpha-D-glucose/dTDP-2,6-dideoxy-D-kanosamine transaminase
MNISVFTGRLGRLSAITPNLAPIPFNDLARQHRVSADELERAVVEVLRRGWYAMGPEVEAFELEFSAFCGTAGCVGVANGTDAIELALRAVGCAPGHEVVMVANAGMYAAAACVAVGATPVFVDVTAESGTPRPESIARLVNSRTRAVVVTHLYGMVADVPAVRAAIGSRDVAIVEDVAQAHGGSLDGTRAGALGDVAAFSFYPTKNLGAAGDGGAVTSNDEAVLAAVRELRQYGWTERFVATRPGGRNSRLDELQAAVLRVKLRHLECNNERRRAIAAAYVEAAAGALHFPHVTALDYVGHLCVARHPDRDSLRASLDRLGVGTAIHYPVPDHRQPALAGIAVRHDGLRETERMAREVFSLPCYPELTDAEIARVGRGLREVL